MDKEERLKQLMKKRDAITTAFFWLGLKIALIFGIPAFLGAFFGRKLDKAQGDGWLFTIVFLALAFVSSWVIVYFQYKKISKKLKAVDEEIISLKKEIKND